MLIKFIVKGFHYKRKMSEKKGLVLPTFIDNSQLQKFSPYI